MSIGANRQPRYRCSVRIRFIIKKAGGVLPPAETQCRLAKLLALGKQLGDRLGFDQLAWLVEVVVDDRLRVDAERVVNRRQQFARVYRIFDRC